jgi:hypothetical protein
MKTITAFILLFTISCGGDFLSFKSENEKFIQGKWRLAGTFGDDENRAWFLEWEFDNGKFTQNGYPPILQEGKYKILEDNKNTLKLKLYKQKGTFGDDDSELTIIVDKEEKTLTINGKKDFMRIIVEKNS